MLLPKLLLPCCLALATPTSFFVEGKTFLLPSQIERQHLQTTPENLQTIDDIRDRAFQAYLRRHRLSELPSSSSSSSSVLETLESFNNDPTRIVGGQDASEGEAPFQAQLFRVTKPWLPLPWLKEKLSFLCGGSFIAPDTVLSAGHCFSESIKYRIRYGSNSRLSSPYPALEVANITVHQNFSMQTIANDLALFKLKSPVRPADNVALISLNRNETLEAGTNLTLFGFGLTNGMRPRPAQSLQKASLRSLDEDQCREFVEELGLRKSPGMICTQTDGRSACNVSHFYEDFVEIGFNSF